VAERIDIPVPDIGDFEEVEVVELLVAKGDEVAFDDPIVSVESDKATMEIPSSAAGIVLEILVSEGDRVSEGSVLVVLEGEPGEAAAEALEALEAESTPEPPYAPPIPEHASPATDPASTQEAHASVARELSPAASRPVPDREGVPHASPLVRRYARELGVPIEDASGSGPHGRVLVDDLRQTVRERFSGEPAPNTGSSGIPAVPSVDFERFGPVHEEPLTRIQKVSGPGLQRSWLNVPHVTQNDEADITELERFRRDRREVAAERGVKLSPLLLLMKAAVVVLRDFPKFRSSLSPEGDRLIVKDYYHLGIAVDTEQGLVVPVIRDVDRKGIFELAEEVNETAERARARKLGPDDLAGACFTISSLGGIGGGHFSQIVNAPEVAILGLSKTRISPVWEGPSPLDAHVDGESPLADGAGRFVPRLTLPFSLSYDHRVIDGADAVRFTSRLARVLADPGNLLL
jgi:pyruvate dehydrogenase E2 component (dihydrolipoamide acetyltransferase)